jgi:anti-anti-sigma factor
MTVVASYDGRRCHLSVEGELTIYHAAQIKPLLIDPLAEAEAVEVDLSGVTEMDSAGMQLLLLLKREAAAAGKSLALAACSAAALRVIDVYNLKSQFGDPPLMAGA